MGAINKLLWLAALMEGVMQVKAESPLVSAGSGQEVNVYLLVFAGLALLSAFLVGTVFGGPTVYYFYLRAVVAQLRAPVPISAEGGAERKTMSPMTCLSRKWTDLPRLRPLRQLLLRQGGGGGLPRGVTIFELMVEARTSTSTSSCASIAASGGRSRPS